MNLVDWAAGRAAWVGDSLRRIATATEHLVGDADLTAIRERVRWAAVPKGVAEPECRGLTDAHVQTSGDAAGRTVITQIGPVENIDRLASDQKLRFAPTGITLVFGENGSGKSGYTRIAKRLCRSLSVDELKGNVFEAGPAQAMRVHLRYSVDGDEAVHLDWSPTDEAPSVFRQISVFDTQNARLYVDRQNKIAYLPAEIAILEHHGALCEKLSAECADQQKELDRRLKVALPAGYTSGGRVGALLAKLDGRSKAPPARAELEGLAGLSTEEGAELARLATELASDPVALANAGRRAAKVLARVDEVLAELAAGLAEPVVERVGKLREDAECTAAAAVAVAADQFAAEPLLQVGGDPWRAMYLAARDYALALGSETGVLPDGEGASCLLCQEPLSERGRERTARFNGFMQGEATRLAAEARTLLLEEVRRVEAVALPSNETVLETLAVYGAMHPAKALLVEGIDVALTMFAQRKAGVLARASDASAHVGAAPADLSVRLGEEVRALRAGADVMEASAQHGPELDARRPRHEELKNRKKLGDDLSTMKQRLEDLEEAADVRACLAELNSRPTSLQITALRKRLVTEDLQQRIRAEVDALDLAHIPLQVSDISSGGKSLFSVGLQGVSALKNNQILSEGEQRALALACFLAEIGGEDARHGLVVDDPVSSLDHLRIRRVASRLVAEAAKGRQVIIFTHSLVFFNEVIAEAAKVGDAAPLVSSVVRKSQTLGFGVIDEDAEPWIARSVAGRIEDLRKRAKLHAGETNYATDAYRRLAKDFYSDLRESWERAVEEVVLNKTVERLVPDVRTQSLKGVQVTDNYYRTIFFAMKRASERSGHDMPAGRDIPVPTPAEMIADVEALDAFRLECIKERKRLTEERKAFELPQKATFA